MLIDPSDPSGIRVGVSTAGVWASTDAGNSWNLINRGMYAEHMRPSCATIRLSKTSAVWRTAPPILRSCGASITNGVFRSEDAGATWREATAIQPSKFGFAVAAHPSDPKTAWFVPAIKDERRIPVDG